MRNGNCRMKNYMKEDHNNNNNNNNNNRWR